MARPKARYAGSDAGTDAKDFSDALQSSLKALYLDRPRGNPSEGSLSKEKEELASIEAEAADTFVGEVLGQASWALGELHALEFDVTKADLRAEQNDLLGALTSTRDKLQNLSHAFDRLLPVGADPLGCAEAIDELIAHVEAVGATIEALPQKPKLGESHHDIAVEMSVRVLRVLQEQGIPTSATADLASPPIISDAIQILKAIGDDIGIELAVHTWRRIVSEAKRSASDLV